MDFTFFEDKSKSQKYSGKLDIGKMFEHILKQNIFYCCNDRMYFYNDDEGRYVFIDPNNEWHCLSFFFDESIRRAIKPSEVDQILKRIKYTADIQIAVDDFNNDTQVINIRNGVLDYNTGKLYQKMSDFRFTYQYNVSYKKDTDYTKVPNFNKFTMTSLDGDPKKIKLLLQIIGYLCSPLMQAKKCFIFLGEPNSGKSLMLHLIEYIAGRENISNIQLEKLGQRFSCAVLSTKQLNICAELSAKPLRDIEMFKLIVGGDTLSGEFKGKDVFEFKNRCKLLFAGNILPPIKNEDISTAFIDRLVILNFPHSIPKEERDYELLGKLEEEADYIFSLAINELLPLIQNNFQFEMPDDTSEILNDYSFQQTNIDEFLEERCELEAEARIHFVDMYKAYGQFCEDNGINPISQNLFSQKLRSVNGVKGGRFRINGSKSMRGFYGINIKKEYLQDSER